MIGKAPHSMFDIVGRYSMMILHTEYLKAYSPDSITKSVRVWDESVRAMWKIMGFDKYPQPHNNRQLGVSVEGGAHMFATWYYCGYSVGDQGNTLKNEVLAPAFFRGTASGDSGMKSATATSIRSTGAACLKAPITSSPS